MTKVTRSLGYGACIGALVCAGACVRAQSPPLRAPENSLLGIPLMATYKTVLHKFGQPPEIQLGAPTNAGPGGQTAQGGGGGPAGPGALSGMPPLASLGGGKGLAAALSGIRPGGPQGGSLPGFNGFRGSNMPAMPNMAAGGAGGVASTAATGEVTWWYHFPLKGLDYAFLFNRHGRVIQIQEYGWKYGSPTRQGIGLGSPLIALIRRYGWSNDGEHLEEGGHEEITMRYGSSHKLAFQLIDNKVAGITIGVVR